MNKGPESVNKIAENAANPPGTEEPQILEEIVVEELSIDGICGVY
jgi:mycofactocin precursor